MSGASIAAEINAALESLAPELGTGTFAITLTRTNAGGSPWDNAGTPESFTIAGNVESYPATMIDGTLIQSEDRRVMLSATGEEPTTAHTLAIGGKAYRIIKVTAEAPQGVALFYEVQARSTALAAAAPPVVEPTAVFSAAFSEAFA